MQTEVWKPVVGFEGLYEVSNLGRVKSLKRTTTSGRELVQSLNRGYKYVVLSKNGKQYNAKVHRLVAESYIPNPEGKKEVNHIDGNKANNAVENLEWATASENSRHAMQSGLNPCWINNPITSKSVDMLSASGTLLKTFPSLKEAERQTGIQRANIQGCCAHRQSCKTAGGYKWRYHTKDFIQID
jgi:hypothetical protein